MGQSVGIRVDARRKQPIHRQIFDEVVARIETRTFPPGYKLPPTRVLALELAAHRNTVARAYADLEAAGFVSSRVGRGTFVESWHEADPKAGAARNAEATQPALTARDLPWSSLLSAAARSDALARRGPAPLSAAKRDPINLGRMQPSFDLIPEGLLRRCIAQALTEHGARALGYGTPEGLPRLREQIARDLVARGVPVRAEDIIVTSASQQALDLVARSLINPGDAVLVEPTTYAGAIDLFGLAGARLVPVPVDAEGPDPDALRRLGRPDVKALYLMPNAHNPSGRTLSAERRRALLNWSRDAGIPIIEDDYAAGLHLEEQAPPPHLRALDGEVIHIATFSKRLAPGMRIGYLVAPPQLRAALLPLKRVVDLGASVFLQHAIAEFLERGYLRAHEARTNREYRARRDALDAALRRHLPKQITWDVPRFGVALWLRLPPSLPPERVYEEAYRRGVLVGPSAHWSVGARSEPGVRLTFCAESSERLVEGAKLLGKACKQLLADEKTAPPRAAESSLEMV